MIEGTSSHHSKQHAVAVTMQLRETVLLAQFPAWSAASLLCVSGDIYRLRAVGDEASKPASQPASEENHARTPHARDFFALMLCFSDYLRLLESED